MSRAVIVTGSSGAIGSALCAAFVATGSHVIGVDSQPSPFGGTDINGVDVDLDAYCRDEAYRQDANDRIRSRADARPIAALVNNAAVQIVKPAGELNVDDWRQTINVNLLAPFLLAQAFAGDLTAVGGAIVNVSSIHARLTKPGFTAYSTSKAGLAGLTRALAIEFGGRVRVNSISPAAVDTPMLRQGFAGREHLLGDLGRQHPAGRIATPAEIAALAVFLASDDAKFITGADFAIDGGIGARLSDPT